MNFKKEYKKQTKKSPYVFDENCRIISNFSYTDNYVLWLENELKNAKEHINDLYNEISCRDK